MLYIIDTQERRDAALEAVKLIRKHPLMSVEIKEFKYIRSKSQNNLLWMWYAVIANDIGETPEHLHEAMKARILGFEQKTILGKELTIPKSTTKLNSKEMTHFLEAVEALAKSLNINLPVPDDYRYAMYGEK